MAPPAVPLRRARLYHYLCLFTHRGGLARLFATNLKPTKQPTHHHTPVHALHHHPPPPPPKTLLPPGGHGVPVAELPLRGVPPYVLLLLLLPPPPAAAATRPPPPLPALPPAQPPRPPPRPPPPPSRPASLLRKRRHRHRRRRRWRRGSRQRGRRRRRRRRRVGQQEGGAVRAGAAGAEAREPPGRPRRGHRGRPRPRGDRAAVRRPREVGTLPLAAPVRRLQGAPPRRRPLPRQGRHGVRRRNLHQGPWGIIPTLPFFSFFSFWLCYYVARTSDHTDVVVWFGLVRCGFDYLYCQIFCGLASCLRDEIPTDSLA